jgi:feruloyl esterase
VLRVPERWNRKLLFQGCRALCGYQATADCDDALARGYAVLTTDTGHTGSLIEAGWAAGNPQARADYAWRAVHLVALAGKDLVARLRGTRPERTYLRGCSNGGRQGLLEAEHFPETFDGVIAGAPLMPGDGVLHLAWSARAVLDDAGQPVLTRDDLAALHDAVLRDCGDDDGLVSRPDRCRPDVMDPRFGRGTPVEHWPTSKRAAARRVYEGPRTRDGRALTAGAPMPGSELAWTSFVAAPADRSIFASLATDYLRHLAFDVEPSPVPDVFALDFERDAPALNAAARRSRPTGDLRAFAARGGKAIVYHGWADESVVPANSIAYARAVRGALGDGYDASFRLYLLPGVGHCSESPGAGRVDWLGALEDWVERGRPPGLVAGTGHAPGVNGRSLAVGHAPADPFKTGDPGR